jgi:hypothetical protein
LPGAVLERDRDRRAAEQVLARCAPPPRWRRLALEQHDVGGSPRGVGRSPDLDGAVAADADDAQPVGLDRRDVLRPGIDQRDVEPAFGEQAAEQAAHRAGADHNDFGFSNGICSPSIGGAAAGDVEHEAGGEAAGRARDPGASSAISSTCTKRPIGIFAFMLRMCSSVMPSSSGVSVIAGAMQFTVTPTSVSSFASALEKPITPAFAAE